MRRYMPYIIAIVAGFVVGFFSSLVQAEALREWYPTLVKSALNPPGMVFGLVWSALYVLNGLSFGRVLDKRLPNRTALTVLFVLQLVLNFFWCWGFFNQRNPWLGLVIIIVLIAVVLVYTILAFKDDKTSGILFLPYLGWLLFATYLNAYIAIHN